MNKQNMIKNGAVGVILIIVIFFAYKFLTPSNNSKNTTKESSTQSISVSSTANIISVNDVDLLRKKLDGIKVNTGIFSSKDFSSLKDYRVVIQPEPVDRNNPFSKI